MIRTCLVAGILFASPAVAIAGNDGGTYLAVGAGFAYFGITNAGTGIDIADNYGLALDLRYGGRFAKYFGINFYIAWGLTEFKRSEDWFNAGVDAGEWTTTAFKDVTSWIGEDDGFQLFKGFAGFFAYVFLAITYIGAGIAVITSPLAASTYLLAGPTVSGHFGNDTIEISPEIGIAGIAFIPPARPELLAGFGPLAGISVGLGMFTLGARFVWSPPDAHGRPSNRSSHLFALSTTFGLRL